MKKTLSLVSLVTAMFLMTGCDEEVKTVEYYKANIEEAKTTFKQCREDVKKGVFSNENASEPSVKLQNCKNATSVTLGFNKTNRPTLGNEPVQKTW